MAEGSQEKGLINILFIFLLSSSGIYPIAQDHENAKLGDELFVIDLAKCQPVSKRYGWGLGYDNVEVKGIEQNRCVIRHVMDWEAKYTVVECRVKTSLKKLAIIKGPLYEVGFNPGIRKYCKVVKRGYQSPGEPEPK